MMLRELRTDAIVDSFRKELESMEFISTGYHSDINKKLDIIADFKEERYKVVKAAEWLWKVIAEVSIKDITQNLRGFNELSRYFEDYADYENLLFALDDNHRDHVIHTIWVMLIGFYLRKKFKTFKDLDYGDAIGSFGEKKEADENRKNVVELVKKHEDSIWCITALTHDLGYPIEKTAKANKIMAKMIGNFGFLEQRDFSYNFTTIHQTAIESLLKTLSSTVLCISAEGYNLVSYSGIGLDYAKSLERLDHGIMSAYLLQMYLDHICETMGFVEGITSEWVDTDISRARDRAIIITLLRAIASHTNIYVYSRTFKNFSSLLLLCDELDEFSRYSCSVTSRDWIKMGCRTEFESTKNSFSIQYTFDNQEIGDKIEDFFRMKVEKIHNRFELNLDNIKKFSIKCRDVRKAEPVELIFEKSLLKYPGGIIKGPSGSCKDMEAFINNAFNWER